MRFSPSLRRGVTLIEAVLFISVALSLIVGGLVFYRQATQASQTARTVRLVTALVNETRALARTADYDGFVSMNPILEAAGAVPSVARGESPGSILSPWGGSVTVTLRTWFEGDPTERFSGQFIFLRMHDMPPEICARIMVFDGETGTGVLGSNISAATYIQKPDPVGVRKGWPSAPYGIGMEFYDTD